MNVMTQIHTLSVAITRKAHRLFQTSSAFLAFGVQSAATMIHSITLPIALPITLTIASFITTSVSKTTRVLKNSAFLPCVIGAVFAGQATAEVNTTRISLLEDQHYGISDYQTLDIYLPHFPVNAENHLTILMLHDGSDKRQGAIVKNKLNRWIKSNVLFASANYRIGSTAKPMAQIRDVAKAVAYLQRKIVAWGGDPSSLVVMGHGEGAYLAALLNVSPDVIQEEKVMPWLSTVALSPIALDAVNVTHQLDAPEYKPWFDNNLDYLRQVSPLYRINELQTPILLVCSSLASEESCSAVDDMKLEAIHYDLPVETLKIRLADDKMSDALGKANDYTVAIESFMQAQFLNKTQAP